MTTFLLMALVFYQPAPADIPEPVKRFLDASSRDRKLDLPRFQRAVFDSRHAYQVAKRRTDFPSKRAKGEYVKRAQETVKTREDQLRQAMDESVPFVPTLNPKGHQIRVGDIGRINARRITIRDIISEKELLVVGEEPRPRAPQVTSLQGIWLRAQTQIKEEAEMTEVTPSLLLRGIDTTLLANPDVLRTDDVWVVTGIDADRDVLVLEKFDLDQVKPFLPQPKKKRR